LQFKQQVGNVVQAPHPREAFTDPIRPATWRRRQSPL
jgi:hypothetical protein